MLIPFLLLAAAAAPAQDARCSFADAAPVACRFVDNVDAKGVHHMTFTAGAKRISFVGRSQSGWWSGTLDRRPAMGFERNRGHIVFSTTDLKTRFAWWYPKDEHGTY